MRERRRSLRFVLPGKVCLVFGEHRFELPIADLSVSGVGVRLDLALLGERPDGRVGTCRIESPELSGPVEAFVSVMRIRRFASRHLVGLRFVSIGDEELRIIEAYEAARRTSLSESSSKS